MSKSCRCPMCNGKKRLKVKTSKGTHSVTCGTCGGTGWQPSETQTSVSPRGDDARRRQKKPTDGYGS